jgi:hypothetical protein
MATKQELDAAKRDRELRKQQRLARLDDWNAYSEFAVSKILGAGGLFIGGLEVIDPNLLPLVLKHPEWYAAGGIALLTGRSVLRIVAKIPELFK